MRIERPEPVINQVHAALRRALLRRQFRAGSRLVETELAQMLGVSRTPVREALRKLESEGLVAAQPGGGVVVCDLEAELVEIYELRQRIEGYAANLAAQRATEDEVAALERAWQAALAALDAPSLERRADLNNAFHRLLLEASHSPRLVRLSLGYRDYFLNQQMLQFYDRNPALAHHRQHEQIVAAVRARDGELAERLIRRHFQSALDVILRNEGNAAGGRG